MQLQSHITSCPRLVPSYHLAVAITLVGWPPISSQISPQQSKTLFPYFTTRKRNKKIRFRFWSDTPWLNNYEERFTNVDSISASPKSEVPEPHPPAYLVISYR